MVAKRRKPTSRITASARRHLFEHQHVVHGENPLRTTYTASRRLLASAMLPE